ncbi:MAG: amino acid permease [Bacteroidota bacterium]
MTNLIKAKAGFGTAPVFFTAISTILGAVMFLRFGYAVGSLGFLGTVVIVVIGHLVTIPTAMAIAEIATNQKVEGGGEYFIISRSFGFNVGGSIGIALFLSQAISVAFYIIAFGEAFDPVLNFLNQEYNWGLTDKRIITLPATFLLGALILVKGADLGVKALYGVVAILFLSLIMFFSGPGTESGAELDFNALRHITGSDSFFYVFAIIFPAFTGMTAGVGLSGDLKDPKKSIPWGTLTATFSGMIIYVFIAYKLTSSATPQELVEDQLIMSKIAIWGPIIPVGLACATISSALGSILVAPRTLQALSSDGIFPNDTLNRFLAKGKTQTNEPVNATMVTLLFAIFFVSIGDVNFVAEIISMFFMVTYGAICSISFLQHFASDPSYRPSFRSQWYISLIGAVMCIYLMFQMNAPYAFASLFIMTVTYLGITYSKKDKQGLVKITQGVIFQFSRRLQVFLQKAEKESIDNWRPTVICISKDTFERLAASELMRWISHKYGFGTYIHFISGYFSRESNQKAKDLLERLIKASDVSKSNVYVDTMISPSYTTAVAQALQLPSVSGKESNMFLFEFSKHEPDNLKDIVENIPLVNAAEFDICILGSCQKDFGYRRQIHIWITSNDYQNANLMILLGYIIIGHPDWSSAQIKIFAVFPEQEISEQKEKLLELIKEGRLPISVNNVELITQKEQVGVKEIISKKSIDADLTIVGMREEAIKQKGKEIFMGYDTIGNTLFVNAQSHKSIK